MYCLKCGRQYADTGTFCPYCGHKPEVRPKTKDAGKSRPRRKLKTARSHTIIGSPGMFRPNAETPTAKTQEPEEASPLAPRRPAITETAPSERKPQRRLFHHRPKSAAPSRTFVRMRNDTAREDVAPAQTDEVNLIAASQPSPVAPEPMAEVAPSAPAPIAPPPLPPADLPPTPTPTSTDVSPPPMDFAPSIDPPEPVAELAPTPVAPPEPAPVIASSSARELEEPTELLIPADLEPEKLQKPSEEKSIEIDAESGLILPSLNLLLGIDESALQEGIDDLLDADVLSDDFSAPLVPQALGTDLGEETMNLNMTFAQGSSPETEDSKAQQVSEPLPKTDEPDPNADLHASWEENFNFEDEDDEEEGMMVLGGGGGLSRDDLNSTRMDAPPSDDDDFDDFVELEDDDEDDDASNASSKTSDENEDEDDEASPKKRPKKLIAGAAALLLSLVAGIYFLFFAGPGFETPTIKLANTYMPESSDIVVGIDYSKLRSSRLYGKLKAPLEDSVQTIRLFHKKSIISPGDVKRAAIGVQGEGDSLRYIVALEGQFESSTITQGLKDTFSWGEKERQRKISDVDFHGSPYEVGLTESGELLFMSNRALTEKSMQIKAAGAGSFLKRENFERGLRMVQTDATIWAVITVTPWLVRELGEWLRFPTSMISTGDIIALSIDTEEGLSLHLAAILNDEEQVVIVEDFVNTLEDRLSPVISADDFDKKDKGALMEVVKSRRFKREKDSLQFSIKASDEVLDDYFEPVYQMVLDLALGYHQRMAPKRL